MAGPPKAKHKGGRPRGSDDPERDYPPAETRLQVLIDGGTAVREAARIVSEETGIPASTLRNRFHLKRRPRVGFDLDTLPFQVMTLEESEEARKSSRKRKAEKEELARLEPPRKAPRQLGIYRPDRSLYVDPRPKKPK